LKPTTRAAGLIGFVFLNGCGGAASLVLKPPIVDKCKDAGLRGCDELADGAILYATGQKVEGQEKLEKGAAKNAPAKVRAFATKLRMLNGIPGADQYVGPLLKVADILSGDETPSHGRLRSEEDANDGPPQGHEHEATAVSQPTARTSSGGHSVTTVPDAFRCAVLIGNSFDGMPGSAWCTPLAVGPLVVTDVHATGECSNTLALGAGPPGAPHWVLLAPPKASLDVHGAAYGVRADEGLFAMQISATDTGVRHDVLCSLTWAATP
jgi:hypothetical protein